MDSEQPGKAQLVTDEPEPLLWSRESPAGAQTPHWRGQLAACEADDIRHRVYEANGIVETIRVVLFDDADSKHIFGRETELTKLLPDLHPDALGRGALIDDSGGMGKTTLAKVGSALAESP